MCHGLVPQGRWVILTTNGNPLHRWDGAPTGAQCHTHSGWGAKSAPPTVGETLCDVRRLEVVTVTVTVTDYSSRGVRQSLWAVLIVWVPPALPSTRGTSRFVYAVSLRGTDCLRPWEAVVALHTCPCHNIPFARALNYGK
jgi:hypothetical protein